jgi:hypothetical protein
MKPYVPAKGGYYPNGECAREIRCPCVCKNWNWRHHRIFALIYPVKNLQFAAVSLHFGREFAFIIIGDHDWLA